MPGLGRRSAAGSGQRRGWLSGAAARGQRWFAARVGEGVQDSASAGVRGVRVQMDLDQARACAELWDGLGAGLSQSGVRGMGAPRVQRFERAFRRLAPRVQRFERVFRRLTPRVQRFERVSRIRLGTL